VLLGASPDRRVGEMQDRKRAMAHAAPNAATAGSPRNRSRWAGVRNQ
jgi:hypothetical protein